MPASDAEMIPEASGHLTYADATVLSKIWPGKDLGSPWLPDELGAVLRHQLGAILDVGPSQEPAVNKKPATYADLLLRDAAPPLEILRGVKDWAKPFTFRADGDLPREVAGVLYYAAILAARLRADARISELDDALLARAARWALRLPWLDASLAQLFRDALAALGPGGTTAGDDAI